MNKKRSVILWTLIINALFLICALVFTGHPYVLTFVSFVQLVTYAYLSYKFLNFKLLSSCNLFLGLSYVFHVGQYFLFMFDINVDIPFNISQLASIQEMSQGLQFYILCQCAIFLGIVLSNVFFKTEKLVSSKLFNTSNRKIYFWIAMILILFGLIPKAYIDISKLKLFMEGNYLNTYTLQVFGFVSVVSHLFEYGMLMLLHYYQEDKKKSFIFLIIGILCEVPIVLSGNRGWATIFILLYFLQYIKNTLNFEFRKLKFYHWLLLIFVVHFSLSIINFISDYRSYPFDSFGQLLKFYIPYIGRFPLADIFGEFGGTMISVIYAMRFIPAFSNYGYGIGYATSCLTVFPNFGNFLSNFREGMIFVYAFPETAYTSLGGSYIGELYYNFGYFGVVFAVLIGLFIGYLFKLINETEKKKNTLLFIICLCFLANILWWIRDYFSSMVREVVWVSVFIVLLNLGINFFKGMKKNGKS